MKSLFILSVFMLISVVSFSQSIRGNADGSYAIDIVDSEKAVKMSASGIKAKQENIVWSTNIDQLIEWRLTFNKNTKMYTLFKNGVKYFESTTIAAIKGRYTADLLGVEVSGL